MKNSSILKFHLLLTVIFLVVLFLPACGSSQAEIKPPVTQAAVSQLVTQTAEAPTSTVTPTFTWGMNMPK
jgi:hypothetical protein